VINLCQDDINPKTIPKVYEYDGYKILSGLRDWIDQQKYRNCIANHFLQNTLFVVLLIHNEYQHTIKV